VKEQTIIEMHGIKFSYQGGVLFIVLPSGRRLSYMKPQIGMNRFGSECVTYMGVNNAKKWNTIESSPGKWVENITQAVARDILYNAMITLKKYPIVMHVHDEVVLETSNDVSADTICKLMCRLPKWAKGLPMRAEGFEANFYLKN
jgi:DNA polymerase